MVPIKNSVVMNIWDDMKQFKSRKTVGLARWILLFKSLQLFVMNKRPTGGSCWSIAKGVTAAPLFLVPKVGSS